jgi:acetyl esterase/lipase
MKRRSIKAALGGVWVCLAALVIGCSGPGHAQQQQLADGVLIQRDLPYGARAQQDLDVCSPPSGGGRAHPAVLLLHGGGWNHGDKAGSGRWCRTLAQQGFVAVSINYRLIDQAVWPAQIVDAQLAVRWLRAHAAQFDIDPGRICAVGTSAGAHLAVYLAADQQTVPGDDAGELASTSSRISCAVDISGPVDLTTQRMAQHAKALVGPLDPETEKARIEEASPLRLVGPQTAPILIIQGADDTAIIPQEQAQPLYDAMRRNGRPVQMFSFAGGHGLAELPRDELANIEDKMFAFVKQYDR